VSEREGGLVGWLGGSMGCVCVWGGGVHRRPGKRKSVRVCCVKVGWCVLCVMGATQLLTASCRTGTPGTLRGRTRAPPPHRHTHTRIHTRLRGRTHQECPPWRRTRRQSRRTQTSRETARGHRWRVRTCPSTCCRCPAGWWCTSPAARSLPKGCTRHRKEHKHPKQTAADTVAQTLPPGRTQRHSGGPTEHGVTCAGPPQLQLRRRGPEKEGGGERRHVDLQLEGMRGDGDADRGPATNELHRVTPLLETAWPRTSHNHCTKHNHNECAQSRPAGPASHGATQQQRRAPGRVGCPSHRAVGHAAPPPPFPRTHPLKKPVGPSAARTARAVPRVVGFGTAFAVSCMRVLTRSIGCVTAVATQPLRPPSKKLTAVGRSCLLPDACKLTAGAHSAKRTNAPSLLPAPAGTTTRLSPASHHLPGQVYACQYSPSHGPSGQPGKS
jgi:hypothetical protein